MTGGCKGRTSSSTQKRERPEKEEPVMEDDNHSVFYWEVGRLYMQPNKDPAGYWAEISS